MSYDKLEAKHCIMVYEDKNSILDRAACILYDKESSKWSNPRPLSDAEVDRIFMREAEVTPPVILDPQVLWYEPEFCLVWYEPPSRRTITIKKKKSRYRHPGLIFKVTKGQFQVAVYSQNENFRPTMDTELYAHPYAPTDVHTWGVGMCRVNGLKGEYALARDAWSEWSNIFYYSGFSRMPRKRNRLRKLNKTMEEFLCI
jgi:hypothetical protein